MASEAIEGQMTDIPRPGLDGRLFTLVFGAVVFGIVAVTSASVPYAANALNEGILGDTLRFTRRQAGYALLGFVFLLFISRVRPKILGGLSHFIFGAALIATALTLTDLPIVHESHGARLWLKLPGGYIVQPSELCKLAYILFAAQVLSQGPLTIDNFKKTGIYFLVGTGLFASILMLQGDHGMTLLVVIIATGLAYIGQMRGKSLAAVVGVVGAGLYGLASVLRGDRIRAFLDPLKYKSHDGFQILTMKIAMARGGISGLGLGLCPEKWRFLPEPHNDAIFAVIGSELGFFGAVLLIAILGAVVWRCIEIGREAPSNVGYFLATGVGIMLAAQIIIHLAVATHLIPITGLTLPFISYGGSSLVSCLVGVGLVLSVHRFSLARQRR